MASPPLRLGKFNTLTDTFDVEIISDLDQRVSSSFGHKSWAIMTYLRPVSVGGSKSKCVIVRVTVLEQGHCSQRKLIHQRPWAGTSRCLTGPAIGCLHMQDSFNRIGRVQQSSVSSHVHQQLQAGFGHHDNFSGWFQLHHTSGKAGPRGWKTWWQLTPLSPFLVAWTNVIISHCNNLGRIWWVFSAGVRSALDSHPVWGCYMGGPEGWCSAVPRPAVDIYAVCCPRGHSLARWLWSHPADLCSPHWLCSGVRWLIEQRAEVNGTAADGRTALNYATHYRFEPVVQTVYAKFLITTTWHCHQ